MWGGEGTLEGNGTTDQKKRNTIKLINLLPKVKPYSRVIPKPEEGDPTRPLHWSRFAPGVNNYKTRNVARDLELGSFGS